MNLHGFTQMMKAGGVTLGVILACSVLALAVGIERLAALWRFLDRARTLGETVKRCLYRGAVAEARAACERSTSLAAEFFLVGFERHGRSNEGALEAAVDRERQRVGLNLKGQLWVLATIGAIAPFVGLFGTVYGILRAFEQIGATHQAGIDVVGPGIAEALITTAAGIVVAIEAMVIYNYFMSRLQRVALELKLMAEEFVELLREQKPDSRPKAEKTEKPEAAAAQPLAAAVKPSPSEA
jgi:biopolymer transport protein ExbB/TolQ